MSLKSTASIAAAALLRWLTIDAPRARLAAQAFNSRSRSKRGNEGDKARKHGISRAFRQYGRRHGKSIDDILQMHAKHPVPHIDHARDRRERARW